MSEKINDTVRQRLLNAFKYDQFYMSKGRYQQLCQTWIKQRKETRQVEGRLLRNMNS